ncbi:MAG: SDR family oxidoreductase [Myxococcota bacterium]
MKELRGKNAVITGAGSGIGRALAIELAGHGCGLALSDIDPKGLEQTEAMVATRGKTHTWVVDVADRAAMQEFARDCVETLGDVDIVINNAGVTVDGDFEQATYEDLEWILGINLWGVMYGCKEFLPHLRRRPEASLVNISSVFGLIGYPGQAAYNITKFGVRGLSEALRQELEDTGVTVTSVHPGGIKTNIARRARMPNRTEEERIQMVERTEALFRTTAKSAAQTIIKGIQAKKPKVLVGPDAHLIDYLQRTAPTAYEKIISKVFPHPGR